MRGYELEMATVREEMDALLRGASEAALREKGAEGDWSCADILAHLTGYTRRYGSRLAAARGVARVALYDAPPSLHDDDFNAIVVGYWRTRPIQELIQEERAAFADLVAEVEALPAAARVAEGHFPFSRGRSLDAILPRPTYLHYRKHFPALRRTLQGTGP
jgi:hypothetical protein